MSTLLDEPVRQQSTAPAERLRTTMAAVRVSLVVVRHQEDPDRRTEGRSRRAVRHRRPLPERGQAAAGHLAPGLQGGHGRPRQGHLVLEVDVACRTPSRASG